MFAIEKKKIDRFRDSIKISSFFFFCDEATLQYARNCVGRCDDNTSVKFPGRKRKPTVKPGRPSGVEKWKRKTKKKYDERMDFERFRKS